MGHDRVMTKEGTGGSTTSRMKRVCHVQWKEEKEEGEGRREGHFAEEAAGKEASDSSSYSERMPSLAELELCPEASNLVPCISRCFWLEVPIKL